MNEELTKRLDTLGLSRGKILKIVEPDVDDKVIIYASCMEGLGTKASDFDIYVLSSEKQEPNDLKAIGNHSVRYADLDPQYYGLEDVAYLYLDIEYWSYETVEKLFQRVEENAYMDDESLKMLLRLATGECLQKGEQNINFNEKKKDIENYIKRRFCIISDGALHDSVSLYENRDYFGALLCAREALNSAVAAYNAKRGAANMNIQKWSSRIFLNRCMDEKMKEKYLKFLIGVDGPIEKYLYEMIIFVQDILNIELSFKGKKYWYEKEKYEMEDESGDYLWRI